MLFAGPRGGRKEGGGGGGEGSWKEKGTDFEDRLMLSLAGKVLRMFCGSAREEGGGLWVENEGDCEMRSTFGIERRSEVLIREAGPEGSVVRLVCSRISDRKNRPTSRINRTILRYKQFSIQVCVTDNDDPDPSEEAGKGAAGGCIIRILHASAGGTLAARSSGAEQLRPERGVSVGYSVHDPAVRPEDSSSLGGIQGGYESLTRM